MALTRSPLDEYTIDTPGFQQMIFTAASPDDLALPVAVLFAADRESVLQSAAEAVAFRISANGTHDAHQYQTTRTTAIYHFNANNEPLVAFDDHPEQNMLLVRPQEGYAMHNSTGKWLVPKCHPLIRGALRRAATANRIVSLEQTVGLSTIREGTTTAYGTSALLRATIGDDLAEAYAQFLKQQGFLVGYRNSTASCGNAICRSGSNQKAPASGGSSTTPQALPHSV